MHPTNLKSDVGVWRRMQNWEPHNLYPSPNATVMIKLRRIIGRAFGTHWEKRNVYKVLVRK
jgi:hypothetical protein